MSVKAERRPLTFGRPRILALLAAVLLIAAVAMQLSLPAYRNREAIRQIERMGGIVITEDSGPEWLRRIIGNRAMKPFAQLYQAWFPDLTDAGLVHLQHLRNVQALSLCRTKVTESGVAELQRALRGVAVIWGDCSPTATP